MNWFSKHCAFGIGVDAKTHPSKLTPFLFLEAPKRETVLTIPKRKTAQRGPGGPLMESPGLKHIVTAYSAVDAGYPLALC
jgi:hypothetical protein